MPDGLIHDRVRQAARAEIERRKRLQDRKEACENSLMEFFRLMWPVIEPTTPLIEGWPLELLCDVLTAVTDGHITRMLINVPPGFSKSTMLNVLWPAWEWGPQNTPGLRYLSASYSSGLAERDNGGDVGRFARVINSPTYRQLWGDRFRVLKDNAGLVENDHTGSKRVITMGGGTTTGFRGDRILIDDANNPADVESETVRATTNIWLREVMPSRLNDPDRSAIICLQQRTHEQDATGTLAEFGVNYDWVVVPMHFDPMRIHPVVLAYDEAGEPETTWIDPRALDSNGERLTGLYTDARGKLTLRPGSALAQAEGELAWPERFSQESCDTLRTTLGEYAYEGQFQQSPGVRGGGLIRRDWWQTWGGAEYPMLGTVIASLDTALEEAEQNDYNALTVWGAFPSVTGEPKLIIIGAWRARIPLATLVARVTDTCRRHNVDYLIIEKKTRGRDVHDEIVRLNVNATWQTILWEPKGTKTSRLNAVSHLFSGDMRRDPVSGIETFSNGLIYAPDRDWADEVINEVAAFPRGAHDDYVDSVTQVLAFVRKHGVALRKVEWDQEEEDAARYRKPTSVPYVIS